MKLFKSLTLLALTGCTVPITACATLWQDPIVQTSPNTFQITHSMGPYSPVKGVRKGIVQRAQGKCTNQHATYQKLREEMGTEGTLSYTLFFQCNPV